MIELGELIRELRSELQATQVAGKNEPFRFEVGPVELNLTLAVTKEGGAGAKIRFWVVELGSDARVTREATQQVKLTLTPLDSETGRSPEISGDRAIGEED